MSKLENRSVVVYNGYIEVRTNRGMRLKVINFYGGAGIGKSTIAADIFSKLKRKGHRTELVGEYAKWLWYQNATDIVEDQLYLFAEQVHRLKTLERYGVEYVTQSNLMKEIAEAAEINELNRELNG